MRFSLTLERELAQPIERVWWALTDRDALAQWFMATDFVPEQDRRFTIRGEPEGAWRGWTDCRILALDQPSRIVWSFAPEAGFPPSTVTFELAPTKLGTRLTLTHEGELSPAIIGQLGQGWPGFLERLAGLLAAT